MKKMLAALTMQALADEENACCTDDASFRAYERCDDRYIVKYDLPYCQIGVGTDGNIAQ